MSDFYITLPSNTAYSGNKSAEFTCPLPGSISLQGEWQVGLAEIQYPCTWNNIEGCWLEIVAICQYPDIDPGRATVPLWLRDGYFATVEEVCEHIVEAWKMWCKKQSVKFKESGKEPVGGAGVWLEGAQKALKFFVDDYRVVCRVDENYIEKLTLYDDLAFALGYAAAKGDTIHPGGRAPFPPGLHARTSVFYIYCDTISFQYVGNTMAQLLKTVPVQGQYGNTNDIHFPSPHYLDVLKRDFDSILISIKGDDGKLIPFQDNSKVIVKLHFRKKRLF